MAPEGPERRGPSEKTEKRRSTDASFGRPQARDRPARAPGPPGTPPPPLGPEWFGVFRGGKEGLLRGNEDDFEEKTPHAVTPSEEGVGGFWFLLSFLYVFRVS